MQSIMKKCRMLRHDVLVKRCFYKKLEEATRHARELEKRCETITATLEAREKEFWSSGGDLSRNRDAIKQEMKKISEDVEKIQEEILQLLIDASTPLFMCKDLVVQSFNSEKALQESEAVRHSTKIITDLFAQIMNRFDYRMGHDSICLPL